MIRASRSTWGRWAAALGVFLGAAACGRTVAALPETSPFYGGSLTPYDALVRHHLLDPDDIGLASLREAGPRDEVVRLMNEGLFLHRMGRYRESNAALQRAEGLSEARYTKRIAQDVASFIVSDNVVDYYASALERSMLHYYGMFNYLALGDPEGAMVEARKANALLRRYGNDNPGRSFVNDAAVQYMAGMLQWGEGEENDAVVSLRQSLAGYRDYEARYGVRTPWPVALDAARIAADMGLTEVAQSVGNTYLEGRLDEADLPGRPSDAGDVVLVIENGFIAHKRQQKLFVPVLRSERDSVLAGSAPSAVAAAVRVMIRTVIVMNELGKDGQSYVQAHQDGVTFVSGALSAAGMELVTMAWPTYELTAQRATGIRVTSGLREIETPTVLMEDLSAIALRDFEERKTSMLVRLIARTLLKEAAVLESERRGTQAGGVLAGLAARVAARTAANATEQADTRSWSGLPAELLLARLRLPPGPNEIRITYQGLQGPETRALTVDVRPDSVVLRTVAVVGRDRGDQGRFRGSTRGVTYEVRSGSPRARGR